MPLSHGPHGWVELTDAQVDLARMALDDFKSPYDPYSAIQLLRNEFSFTLKHALCAIAYARKHPHPHHAENKYATHP